MEEIISSGNSHPPLEPLPLTYSRDDPSKYTGHKKICRHTEQHSNLHIPSQWSMDVGKTGKRYDDKKHLKSVYEII